MSSCGLWRTREAKAGMVPPFMLLLAWRLLVMVMALKVCLTVCLQDRASWRAHIICARDCLFETTCYQLAIAAASSRVSASMSHVEYVNACALFQSKCSTHVTHALTAGCPSMPSCGLSVREPVHSCTSCGRCRSGQVGSM